MNKKEWNERKSLAISKERIEGFGERIRNVDKEIMESHRREQRMSEVKVIQSIAQNPQFLLSLMNKGKKKKSEWEKIMKATPRKLA